jgi:hypothetical protein
MADISPQTSDVPAASQAGAEARRLNRSTSLSRSGKETNRGKQ